LRGSLVRFDFGRGRAEANASVNSAARSDLGQKGSVPMRESFPMV
jgi:hypothetical protein